MKKLYDLLSSYGLACALLLCMFFLTLFGTFYQVDHGLYAAKMRFFSSWFLWTGEAGASLPYFPGGLTCMLLLTINMILGGFIRMRITKRNIGVVIIHFGVAFMLLAGGVKILLAQEGNLTLAEGQRSNTFRSLFLWEVAIWDLDGGQDQREFVIPDAWLTDLEGTASRRFTSPDLPFELELSGFLSDCRVLPKGPDWTSAGPPVDGFGLRPGRTGSKDATYVAGLHVRALADGKTQDGLLWGLQRQPLTVHAGGRRWAIDLRHERYPMPFTIRLDRFEKIDYPGMTMAKAYKSTVTKFEGGAEERVLIQMNEPLRRDNLILFQSSFGNQGGRNTSTFSVVRNVSDKWPEYSLYVVTIGMLLAFGLKLYKYILREAKNRPAQSTGDRS
jgi:hypothetical protein